MKKHEFLQDAIGEIDDDLILDAGAVRNRSHTHRRYTVFAVAACLVLIVATLTAVWLFGNRGHSETPVVSSQDTEAPESTPTTIVPTTYEPNLFNALENPEMLTGSPLTFLTGSSTQLSAGVSAAPPPFEFESTGIVVKVRVLESLPDSYCELLPSGNAKPKTYRLIRFETLEVINGGNIPSSFLYLLPEYLFVDMSVYDSLIISMELHGIENYVLRNLSQNKMEAFPTPIYSDDQDHPELGNVIAFSDGIFDESLWQTPSWLYGYQFARWDLEENSDELVVKRGGSESETIQKIKQQIDEENAWREEHFPSSSQPTPLIHPSNFQTEEAKNAFLYVQPFTNGVFAQGRSDFKITYRRYINGCPTDEIITIDRTSEEVTYSEARYTEEDLAAMENISLRIAEKSAEYQNKIPVPPHTDPEGKKLLTLALFGWYMKIDGTVYGIVKTVWLYQEEGDYYTQYYDDAYTLYDASNKICRDISRDDLVLLVGEHRNIYSGEYGKAFEVPMC